MFSSKIGNHHLYNVYNYFVGDTQNLLAYRIPAIVFGTGTVVAALLLFVSEGWIPALVSTLFFTSSHLLVQYSSEAAGYSPAVFLQMVSLIFLKKIKETGLCRFHVALSLTLTLGVLNHLAFAQVFLTLFICIFFVEGREYSFFKKLRKAAAIFAMPGSAMAFLLLVEDAPAHFFRADLVLVQTKIPVPAFLLRDRPCSLPEHPCSEKLGFVPKVFHLRSHLHDHFPLRYPFLFHN
jgi:hypothetical protein